MNQTELNQHILKDNFLYLELILKNEHYILFHNQYLIHHFYNQNKKHDISVVVDRLISREDNRSRLAESIETALKITDGIVVIDIEGKEKMYSTNFSSL